jgi:hypothetical protein
LKGYRGFESYLFRKLLDGEIGKHTHSSRGQGLRNRKVIWG